MLCKSFPFFFKSKYVHTIYGQTGVNELMKFYFGGLNVDFFFFQISELLLHAF